MDLNILFVEDEPQDFDQIHRQLTEYFAAKEFTVDIDGKKSFEAALSAVQKRGSFALLWCVVVACAPQIWKARHL